MKNLVIAAALLLALAVPVQAQVSVAGGGSQDWVKLGDGLAWGESNVNMMPGIEYHMATDSYGKEGVTMSFRGSEDGDTVQEYGIGYWHVSPVEWFVHGVGETWGPALTGEREFLGGLRAGIRGEAIDGLPVEMSFRYTRGGSGKAHAGVFFGLYK